MAQPQLQRHVGRLKNTGSNVVVVMPEIPGREDHALVVESDSLPPKFHDDFVETVTGSGQREHDLADFLTKVRFSNGEIMLQALHENGHLKPYPIKNVVMLITKSGDNMDLQDIVAAIRQQRGDKPLQESADPNTVQAEAASPTVEPNAAEVAETATNELTPEDQAKNLLMQADLLQKDVETMRERAYELDPNSKPKKRGRPKKKAD